MSMVRSNVLLHAFPSNLIIPSHSSTTEYLGYVISFKFGLLRNQEYYVYHNEFNLFSFPRLCASRKIDDHEVHVFPLSIFFCQHCPIRNTCLTELIKFFSKLASHSWQLQRWGFDVLPSIKEWIKNITN